MKHKNLITIALALLASAPTFSFAKEKVGEPVDYVNPYIGNISHLLVPTFPTIQLPNSMLRVYPVRADYTSELLDGLPVLVTNHRERSAFRLSVTQGEELRPVIPMTYDNEHLTPYSFDVDVADGAAWVRFAVAEHSAAYRIHFNQSGPVTVLLTSMNGSVKIEGSTLSASQKLDDRTTVYVYMIFDRAPQVEGILTDGRIGRHVSAEGRMVCGALKFASKTVSIRYGVSFISIEQAKANLEGEIKDFNVDAVASRGRKIWNEALSKIRIKGGSEDDKTVFYTSYYRTFERPICMSEGGRYWSAFDGKVHDDNGTPFYTDDWIWDTYRAAHPLRTLVDVTKEEDILASYLRMAEQMGNMWMPTFPEVNGDSRRMNSNHAIPTFADAIAKGLNVDKEKAFEASYKGLKEKTLAPWCGNAAGWIDEFYWKNGYVPALKEGEAETDPNVHRFEKRQPVAVSLGTAYDCWCISKIAESIGRKEDAEYFLEQSLNYRKLFNDKTSFFHPKDKDGNWIEPLDYDFPGGMGAREYYDENNAWVYRWDVQHNIPDLIALMGGSEKFIANLDYTFTKPLGRSKFEFFAKLPDHTGNVGQFSMANEPSLHIPYLYNYAGAPWKTQKRIRQMLRTWFRNDLMGIPGDEDGGGLTSFVVFSSVGLYPVTPGDPFYTIGSPLFEESELKLSNGKTFKVIAHNVSDDNKYIQSATLNGKPLNTPWLSHETVMNGGTLVLEMNNIPNKDWGHRQVATVTTPDSTYTIPMNGDMPANPFIRHMYTADPSARVWKDGRLYIYASHDIAPPRGCDLMDKYHVFSTDDMVNWTDHGEILCADGVPWGRKEGGFMWAPDCAYRNGKYYFYFPHPSETITDHSWRIGVAVSRHPDRGFKVKGWIKDVPPYIDPCVFVDDDGQAYLYNGGSGHCFGGKLKKNMMELDGPMTEMQGLEDFHEGTWVHKYNGKYYLVYPDNYIENGVQYNRMHYAMSDSPLGPWDHKGIFLDRTDCDTMHGSVACYKGQWYVFYHNCALSHRGNLRSICVDKLYYNEDGTIRKVEQRDHCDVPRK